MHGQVDPNEFYTLKGYDQRGEESISPAMEDYLEMICRSIGNPGFVRVSTLAAKLNVKPSSASKMVARLREQGLVDFERYGVIVPTKKGEAAGEWLLRRHRVLEAFFRMVNHSENELELVEKIEHFIDPDTVGNIERMLKQIHEKIPPD